MNDKRTRKTLCFDSDEYPTEASVRKAIQTQVVLANTKNERAKVGAKFGAITGLYREKHLPTLRHSTQITNGYLLKNYIEPRWTDEPLQDVTPLRVLNWLGELGELAPTTKAAIRATMSKCFQLAALHGYIPATDRNPMSVVSIKGTTKREKQIVSLTPAQFKGLVAALPAPLNVMALLAGSLGLRVGELLALHWEDIDWTEKAITIQRSFTHEQLDEVKNEASNAVLPLDDLLLAVLKAHQATTGDSALLFPSPRNGGYRSASMLMAKGLRPVALRLELGRVTWHGLRHACRTWLDAKGVPVGLQKDLLRHSDISTTMNRYGRALQPDMRIGHSAMVRDLVPDSMKG
ncbi:MAG: site-specific integrase [Terracidiphilus sp.]